MGFEFDVEKHDVFLNALDFGAFQLVFYERMKF